MKAELWLRTAAQKLAEAGVASARLDSLILLEDCTHHNRAKLLAHPELLLTREQIAKLNKQVAKRATHEPLAYIRGFSEFYGRRFRVNKRVLEPRPESETMIELLLQTVRNQELQRRSDGAAGSPSGQAPAALTIADIGTGTGCLGITAKLELPAAEVDLYDIDSSALAVARHNCLLHELHLHAYKQDLLSRPVQEYDILLANLPYVPDTWQINQAAAMEPKIAIFGGSDGLDLYRRLFEQLVSMKHMPNLVFTESLPPQHKKLIAIAQAAGYKPLKTADFIIVFGS